MPKKPLYLAVDAGGTKCLATLVDPQVGVIRFGHGGPCNPDNVGLGQAQAEIRRAVVEAAGDAQVITRLAIGLAGLDTPKAEAEAHIWVGAALAETGLQIDEIIVENDAVISLKGASRGRPGLLLVAGTGSIAVATNAERSARAGGWGFWIGDVGSGLHLARLGLIAAYARHDRGLPPGPLAEQLTQAAGVADLFDLQGWLYGADRAVEQVAGLSRAVAKAADLGDPDALAALQVGGSSLADEGVVAAQQVGLSGAFPIFLVGGVVTHCLPLRAALIKQLKRAYPEAMVTEPTAQPVLGAALVALGDASPELIERLSQQLAF